MVVVFSTSSCLAQEVLWPMLDLVSLVCLAWINLILHQADAEYIILLSLCRCLYTLTSDSKVNCGVLLLKFLSWYWDAAFTRVVPFSCVQQDCYVLPGQLIQHHAWISYASTDFQWGVPSFSSHGGFGFSKMLIKFAALEFQLHAVNNSPASFPLWK